MTKTPEQLAEEKYPDTGNIINDLMMSAYRTMFVYGYTTRSQEAQEMEVWVEVPKEQAIDSKNTVWIIPKLGAHIWLEKRTVKIIK